MSYADLPIMLEGSLLRICCRFSEGSIRSILPRIRSSYSTRTLMWGKTLIRIFRVELIRYSESPWLSSSLWNFWYGLTPNGLIDTQCFDGRLQNLNNWNVSMLSRRSHVGHASLTMLCPQPYFPLASFVDSQWLPRESDQRPRIYCCLQVRQNGNLWLF